MSNETTTADSRGEAPFPPPMYAHMHGPFSRPTMGLINPGGTGAFRPVLSPDDRDSYHSAFIPTKRSKVEDINTSPGRHDDDAISEGSKDGQLSSPGASALDLDNRSDGGDSLDRGTPDSEGRSLRRRKRSLGVFVDGCTVCPACGLSIRAGEIKAHYEMEIEKLDKRRSSSRENTPQGRKAVASTSSSCSGRRGTPTPEAAAQSRFESYLRIKANRQNRLNVKNRLKKRKAEESMCPVCEEKLAGSPDELNAHVEHCLKRRGGCDIAGAVDVEGEGSDEYEEYTWAGQTRIRASTMLPAGLAGAGFHSSSKKEEDDGSVLNVDGDDNEQYGRPQYSEASIIPCREDEPAEEKERQALRGAVLGDQPSPPSSHPDSSKWHNTPIENGISNSPDSQHKNHTSSPNSKMSPAKNTPGSPRNKCLICMEQYSNPLTSIQCWHVHCEECWLRTLGAKKLCPQCNMITSPADLRRIYL